MNTLRAPRQGRWFLCRSASLALVCLLGMPSHVAALSPPIPSKVETGTFEDQSGPDSVDPGRVIALFEDGTIPRDAFVELARAGAESSDVTLRNHGMLVIDTPEGLTSEELTTLLTAHPDVAVAAPDFSLTALGIPDDPAYVALVTAEVQRAYLGPTSIFPHAINVEPVWEAALGDGPFAHAPGRDGVSIAIIDTGVTPTFREDTGEYVMVWDYVNSDPNPADDNGHGTAVASIIRAQTDNAFGIAGVLNATRARVLVYKTLSARGEGSAAWTIEAMLDAAARGARVINLSLGVSAAGISTDQRALLQHAVSESRARGSLVFAAAGNSGTPQLWYPAASSGAVAVGAVEHLGTRAGSRWPLSNYGAALDLVAPGVGIWTVAPNDAAQMRSGTSAATALASGTAALLWSFLPGLSADLIEDALVTGADSSVGPLSGFDGETGHGRIDAYAALSAIKTRVTALPPLQVRATHIGGFEYELSWSHPSKATGLLYRFGVDGIHTCTTTSTSARVFVSRGGQSALWVRAFASNRWAAEPTTVGVTTTSELPPLARHRHGGRTRYHTAALVSAAGWSAPASGVVLASGIAWPDALVAAPLAHASGGPVLLTQPDRLSTEARDELLRLRPRRVLLVGGESALRPVVHERVRALLPGAEITRIGGVDRYETAAHVAQHLSQVSGLNSPTAFIASGEHWPDALAAGPVAAASRSPILLARRTSLPPALVETLKSHVVSQTVVVGGPAVLGHDVVSKLPSPVRVAGPDRYATARALADWAHYEGHLIGSGIGIATGSAFPDALVAGPLLAKYSLPLVFANPADTQAATWLTTRRVSVLHTFGGPSALSWDAESAVLRQLRGASP